jgi:predicted ATPase with chaperone activity
MTEIAVTPAPQLRRTAPTTIEDAGLTLDLVTDLVLKLLHRSAELSGKEIAHKLGVLFGVIEPALEAMKVKRHCEITGGPSLGGPSFRYRLTDAGHARAVTALADNQYVGVAPVSVEEYRRHMHDFRRAAQQPVTSDQVRAAFSHLVVSDRVLDEIGTAVNGGHSIFIYGPPGNGKTIMSEAIRTLLPGTIAIPHALHVSGQIIRFFDPTVHQPIAGELDPREAAQTDRRWIDCHRPMVTVGGELTLEDLALGYNPRSGIHQAPVQALANGGILLIDEFGRQRCRPRDLLNWWMVPLESAVEMLTLQSGEKIEMPFFPLVIFSTNLKPSELVDEAFLRRIQYKIYAESPTPDEFVRIFRNSCDQKHVPFEPRVVAHLLDHVYRPRGLQLRACHPRDLINQALSIASYRGQPRALTVELIDEAAATYFIEDRETSPSRT